MLATYKLTDNKPQPLLRVKLSVGGEGCWTSRWRARDNWPHLGRSIVPLQLAERRQLRAAASLPPTADAPHRRFISPNPTPPHTTAAAAHVAPSQARLLTRGWADPQVLSLADVPGMEGLTSDTRNPHINLADVCSRRARVGRVVLWKAARVATAEAPERAWEPLAPANVSSPPVQLAWAQGEGMLAARGEGGLRLLPKTVLRRVMSGKWCLVQLMRRRSRAVLRCERACPCALARVTPAIAITQALQLEHTSGAKAVAAGRLPHQGLRHARGAGARVVWRCGQVHEFDDSPGAPRSVSAFASAAVSGAIWDESLPAYEWSGQVVNRAREVHATFYGGGGRP